MEGDFRIDHWLIQPQLNTIVSPDNKTVQLEPKVMEVLVYLADRAGEVISKENLLQALWGDTFVTGNALTRCIAELRKAFQDDAEEPRIIQTITKRGYSLIVSVSKLKAAATRYEILEKLGQGAMGEVFLANDTELHRKVALKFVLEGKGPDENARKRLLREARAAAAQASRLPFRRGWTAALAGAAVVLAATGWLWFSRFRSPVAEAPVAVVRLTTFPGSELSPSFSPDGNQVAFAWNGEQANNYDIYVQMMGSGRPLRLTTDPATDSAPAWSPNGKQIAFLRELSSSKRALLLVPPLGGSERRLAELNIARGGVELGSATLAWHPEGKHLAVEDAGALFLLSTETGEKRRLTTPPLARAHRHPAFSPDGRNLAFCQGDFTVTTLNGLMPSNIAVSPHGRTILYTQYDTYGHDLMLVENFR